jgi:crotonobetainyl-CoA:carnitine CoA-transferase CaiB-like acyl-CoA transferase
VLHPAGNRDPYISPHGVYPCAGDDSWIAIACVTNEHWHALTELMKRRDLMDDSRFAQLDARLRNQDALDAIIGDWTMQIDAHELESLLQSRRIPSSKVASSDDMNRDPQLAYRGHVVELDHPHLGKVAVERSAYTLSRTPSRVERSAPTLGRDNSYVLETILGYDRERIAQLTARGILQ